MTFGNVEPTLYEKLKSALETCPVSRNLQAVVGLWDRQ